MHTKSLRKKWGKNSTSFTMQTVAPRNQPTPRILVWVRHSRIATFLIVNRLMMYLPKRCLPGLNVPQNLLRYMQAAKSVSVYISSFHVTIISSYNFKQPLKPPSSSSQSSCDKVILVLLRVHLNKQIYR